MGLFDNVLRSLDNTLKAIEDGAIEKKITEAVDALDKVVEKAPETLEKVADAPQKAMGNLFFTNHSIVWDHEYLQKIKSRPACLFISDNRRSYKDYDLSPA
jgi:predicted RecB family endonuclease